MTRIQNTGDGNDILISIENVSSGDGDDTVVGNSSSNYLNGGNGNDTLIGNDGNDSFYGGDGDDNINGGEGVDLVYFSYRSNQIDLSKTISQDTGDGNDILISIENVNSGNGDDTVIGSTAANNLFGGNGNDNLSGGEGNDYLNGGSGNDIMSGGSGNDRFVVDSTSDIVIENFGEGTDLIYSYATNFTAPSNVENLYLYGFLQYQRHWKYSR